MVRLSADLIKRETSERSRRHPIHPRVVSENVSSRIRERRTCPPRIVCVYIHIMYVCVCVAEGNWIYRAELYISHRCCAGGEGPLTLSLVGGGIYTVRQRSEDRSRTRSVSNICTHGGIYTCVYMHGSPVCLRAVVDSFCRLLSCGFTFEWSDFLFFSLYEHRQ